MSNVVRPGPMFSNQVLRYSSRPDAPHCSAIKPLQINGHKSAKKLKFRPTPPNYRTTKDWTAMGWPTSIQSGTSDGKFGPAKQMQGWGDCWFLAPLAAVANDPNGRRILAESIKQVNGGYEVTFQGLPNNNVFISDSELKKCQNENGGDADTRLMELAADKFFKKKGNFKSLHIARFLKTGMHQKAAEQCFEYFCIRDGIRDASTHNPMRRGGEDFLAFFMLTGMNADILHAARFSSQFQRSDVLRFLKTYITNYQTGASMTIRGFENPLGENDDSHNLVLYWDIIRTEITSNSTVNPQAFLNALNNWLATRSALDLKALTSAAGNLNLVHIDPVAFVNLLNRNQSNMNQEHFNLLRSGVQELLGGKPGYIGFVGHHTGTIEGINAATNKFTYSEPNNPTLVHTGALSDLIQAIKSGNVWLSAVMPPTEQNESMRFEHAGTSRGRRLSQLHKQVVRDGKIDQAESGALADLMEIDSGAFWQVYDNDKNGVIDSDELKAVKLRVDRMVEQLKLAPIW